MSGKKLNLTIDIIVLTAAIPVFISGFVFLFGFHVSHGFFRESVMNLSRHAWLNIHRISAIFVFTGFSAHVALHWKPLKARVLRLFKRASGKGNTCELVMYLSFSTMVITGFVAWLYIDRSMPLFAHPISGKFNHVRHGWIDVHNIAGLVAFPLVFKHVWDRRRWMIAMIKKEVMDDGTI